MTYNNNYGFLKVLSGGQTTSLQDKGRFGFQDRGVPPSGVINYHNMVIANSLVGNHKNTEVLEIFNSGPVLEINTDQVLLALIGSIWSYIEIIDKNIMIRSGRSVKLKRGDKVRVVTGDFNLISTLAVSGGFNVKKVLGSKSTNPSIKLGGFEGDFLKDGMNLPLNKFKSGMIVEKLFYSKKNKFKIKNIRVLLGPHDEMFNQNMIIKFFSTNWKITNNFNRMGIKLNGNKIVSKAARSMLSDGNQTGSIQVPLNGLPIILLPDRGTTGGYPKIATIISADFDLISKLVIGQFFNFQEVGTEEAKLAFNESQKKLIKKLSLIKKV